MSSLPCARQVAQNLVPLVGYTLRTIQRYVRLDLRHLSPKLNPLCWGQGYSYFLGLCESVLQQQNFISRAAMLEQLQAGTVKLSDEQIFANYGRAALNLLVQLVPLINSEIAGMQVFRLALSRC